MQKYYNKLAEKTKNDNQLRSKTQNFKITYEQSSKRSQRNSSMHELAEKLYSSRGNQDYVPTITKNRQSSCKNHSNPEMMMPPNCMSNSRALSGLSIRVSHIHNYAEVCEADIAQHRFANKEAQFIIPQQIVKIRNCKISQEIEQNQLQKLKNERLAQMLNRQKQLNRNIEIMEKQLNEYSKQKNDICQDKAKKEEWVHRENQNCKDLRQKINEAKFMILKNQKEKNVLKSDLLREQQLMTVQSVTLKELENERAKIMLQINQFVYCNKL